MKNKKTSKVIIKELSCQLFVARCKLKMQQQNEAEWIDAIKQSAEDDKAATKMAAEMHACDAIVAALRDAANEIRCISPETARNLDEKADAEKKKEEEIFKDFLKNI